jgi:hypothetical protein
MALIAHTSFAGAGNVSAAVNTSGATLLVAVLTTGTGMQDSKSNTWTQLTPQTGQFGSSQAIWYVSNPIVGTLHTFQDSGGANLSSACIEAHDSFSAFDVETGASNVADTGSGGSGGSLTPSTAANLMISGIGGGPNGLTIGSGYTISDQVAVAGGSNFGSGLAYLIQASATAQNPIWSGFSTAASGICNAVFKGGGGGTAYTLTADAGSYAVTGTAVTFPVTRKITADSGSYLVTGTAATLTAAIHTHYTITALSGSYLITGTRATLRWSGAPPVTGNFPQCLNIAVMGL